MEDTEFDFHNNCYNQTKLYKKKSIPSTEHTFVEVIFAKAL